MLSIILKAIYVTEIYNKKGSFYYTYMIRYFEECIHMFQMHLEYANMLCFFFEIRALWLHAKGYFVVCC